MGVFFFFLHAHIGVVFLIIILVLLIFAVCIPVLSFHVPCPALCILLKTNLDEATGLFS